MDKIELRDAIDHLSELVVMSQIKHDDVDYRPLTLRDDSGRDDAATLTLELDRDPEMDRMLYETFGFEMGRTQRPESKVN